MKGEGLNFNRGYEIVERGMDWGEYLKGIKLGVFASWLNVEDEEYERV